MAVSTTFTKKLRVGILFGGRSCEHEISLISAFSVIAHLDREKYEIVPIRITRDGTWSHELFPSLVLDVIFPVLHGTYGEDGAIQGLLEILNIPYVGCGVLGSALGMDKVVAKMLLRAAGLPVVNFLAYSRREWEQSPQPIIHTIEQNLGYPCFIKPANGGSSIGVTKAISRQNLCDAMHLACRYDNKILIEQAINCRELECSVLGNCEPQVSSVGEVMIESEFYDYQAKYFDAASHTVVPAHIVDEMTHTIQSMAKRAFHILNLNGLARIDFFLAKETNQIYLNEVNTLPSFTPHCMYAKLWAASGLPYSNLLDLLIALAFERFADRQCNQTFV